MLLGSSILRQRGGRDGLLSLLVINGNQHLQRQQNRFLIRNDAGAASVNLTTTMSMMMNSRRRLMSKKDDASQDHDEKGTLKKNKKGGGGEEEEEPMTLDNLLKKFLGSEQNKPEKKSTSTSAKNNNNNTLNDPKADDGDNSDSKGSNSNNNNNNNSSSSSSSKNSSKKSSTNDDVRKQVELQFSLNNLIRNALIFGAFYAAYTMLTEREHTGREIYWQTFKTHLLNAGEVERLVVVNKQICKVYLRPGAGGRISADAIIAENNNNKENHEHQDEMAAAQIRQQEKVPGGFSSPPPPASSSSLPPGSHNPQFFFAIGSIDSFERKLEIAQRELGLASKDFIPVQYVNETSWLSELGKFAPTLLIIGAYLLVMRSMGGGGLPGGPGGGGMGQIFKIGKSPAKVFGKDNKIKTTFKDVAGCDEAKAEIVEFVDFLRNPSRFTKLGAKIPKGALLMGPPGTGKTLLAKAVAGEANVPFYSISGSDFIEMFVGVGPSRVRDLFSEAREHAPCIVFIDEIDAVARARGKGGFSGGSDERENTLNQLLVEMDGFSTKDGVVVLAGTNRIDILDPAILRPGRFDRQIKVDLPDIKGRRDIFLVHLKKVSLEGTSNEDVARRMAALTPGFSGAQIANVCNEAAIFAARANKEKVDLDCFEKAVERVMGGLEKRNSLMTVEEKRTIAYHEAGHAIAGWFLEYADPLLKVSIVPRTSGALGFAQYLPKEFAIHTTDQILDRMAMALGGRAAEELFFKKISTGAHDDLTKVTSMAVAMVTKFGMNSRVGQVVYNDQEGQLVTSKPYSEATAHIIDEEVKQIIDTSYDRVKSLLTKHSDAVKAVAERLMQKETISQHDIVELVGERPFPIAQNYHDYLKRAGVKDDLIEEKEQTANTSSSSNNNTTPESPSSTPSPPPVA